MKGYIFPAGRYYIGDPCYVIEGEDWGYVLLQTGFFGCEPYKGIDENYFTWNGKTCWGHSTAYGDGCYYDQKGWEFWVDSGSLGIIPAEAIEDSPDFRGGYQFITFDKPFEVCYDEGIFSFGNIIIPTVDEEEQNYA